MAEQAEERIWMRVHHAANIDAAQPQDVLKCAPALASHWAQHVVLTQGCGWRLRASIC